MTSDSRSPCLILNSEYKVDGKRGLIVTEQDFSQIYTMPYTMSTHDPERHRSGKVVMQ
ncbi:MAG TPA: hypothetical protein PKY85_10005 [Nitrosomonas sp.]|nr:hypothetical protein [Nitrosomonas sp.]